MKTQIKSGRRQGGYTMADMLVSSAATVVLAAGMMTGVSTVERSFAAADHYAKSQVEQTRILDYIARDLRRAREMPVIDTYQGKLRITIKIPDYYDASGSPRDPAINSGSIAYGDPGSSLEIRYYQFGSTIYRSVNGATTAMASNVEDFLMEPKTAKQVTEQMTGVVSNDARKTYDPIIGVSVTFVPKFELHGSDVGALRAGTKTYTTTLLRNLKRY